MIDGAYFISDKGNKIGSGIDKDGNLKPFTLKEKIMNWNDIADKYPKAVKLVSSLSEYSPGCWYNEFKPSRNLYDFFDANDIFVEASITCPGSWDYDIFRPNERGVRQIADQSNFISRTEAESAAFTKAFEILETKLK